MNVPGSQNRSSPRLEMSPSTNLMLTLFVNRSSSAIIGQAPTLNQFANYKQQVTHWKRSLRMVWKDDSSDVVEALLQYSGNVTHMI